MTEVNENKSLTHGKLRRLIDVARKHDTADESQQIESVDFDWLHPHHFSIESLTILDFLAKKIEERTTDILDSLCQGPFIVTLKETKQHFASFLAADVTTNQQDHYFLPLMTEDESHCGFVNFSIDTAYILVALMLREVEQIKNEDRRLSGLEDSILADIISALFEGPANILTKRGAPAVETAKTFTKGVWPVEFEGLEDLTSMTYGIKGSSGEFEFTFTLLSTILDPAVGVETNSDAERTLQKLTKTIMTNVHKVPIEVTARMCTASIELDDVMNLRSGDLLLLERKIAEPLEVLLNDQKCFKAYPATLAGKYALVIAPPEDS